MKLKIFVPMGIALFLLSSCQKKNEDQGFVSQHFVHKYGFEVSEKEWENRNKNGEIITALKNGITKTSSYKSGVLHGTETLTFPNSTIIQERLEYDEGKLIKKTVYDNTGLPIQEDSFDLDGKKIITKWDKNGVPLSMEEYEKELLWTARYYTSKNEMESSISEGKGTRIKRNREGLLLSQENVENGIITNRKTFHPSGEIQSLTCFLDYQIHGKQQTFSPAGKLLTSVNWDHGKINGIMTCYQEGQTTNEIPYVNGKKHGIEKEYDLKGALVKEIHWDNDKKHGSARSHFNDFTDIQWFWKGTAVDLQKFQELKLRDELMADLYGVQPSNNDNSSNSEELDDSKTF